MPENPAEGAPTDPQHPGHSAERAGIVDQQAVVLDQINESDEREALDNMEAAGRAAGHTVPEQDVADDAG